MNWEMVLVEPVKMMMQRIGMFIPAIIGFLIIIFIGWIAALLIKKMLVRFFNVIKVDGMSGRIGFSGMLEKAGIRYTFSELLAGFFYWIVIIVAFATALNSLGLTVVGTILDRMILFVPNIVIAVFVLIFGTFLSTFLSGAVVTACANAGINQARIFGKMVSIIIMVLAVGMALEQLNIATTLINAVIVIIFASVGLAFAIAFGLGSKDAAQKLVSGIVESFEKNSGK